MRRSVHFTLARETMNLIHRSSEIQSERNAYRLFIPTYLMFEFGSTGAWYRRKYGRTIKCILFDERYCLKFCIQKLAMGM